MFAAGAVDIGHEFLAAVDNNAAGSVGQDRVAGVGEAVSGNDAADLGQEHVSGGNAGDVSAALVRFRNSDHHLAGERVNVRFGYDCGIGCRCIPIPLALGYFIVVVGYPAIGENR